VGERKKILPTQIKRSDQTLKKKEKGARVGGGPRMPSNNQSRTATMKGQNEQKPFGKKKKGKLKEKKKYARIYGNKTQERERRGRTWLRRQLCHAVLYQKEKDKQGKHRGRKFAKKKKKQNERVWIKA